MTIKHLIPSFFAAGVLLTGCITTEKLVDDDVYVLKSVEVPTNTDISDETDYHAFAYRQRHDRSFVNYYTTFYLSSRPYWNSMYLFNRPYDFGWNSMAGWGGYGFGPGMSWGWGHPNYYGYYGSTYYYPYWNPYYGWGNPYCSPYAYGGYGGYGYYGNGGTTTSGNYVSGPRGAISGFGGVRSQSAIAYKSVKAPSSGLTNTVQRTNTNATVSRVVTKPITTYDRIGRNPSPAVRNNETANRSTGAITRTGSHPAGTVDRPASAPRPASTTGRTTPSLNSGSGTSPRTSSPTSVTRPSRGGISIGTSGSSGRSGGTISNGPSSRPSSGSSGRGTSRSGGSGGTNTGGRR